MCFGGLRLLLHKAKTASAEWRDEADEVSEFESEAVKGKVQRTHQFHVQDAPVTGDCGVHSANSDARLAARFWKS